MESDSQKQLQHQLEANRSASWPSSVPPLDGGTSLFARMIGIWRSFLRGIRIAIRSIAKTWRNCSGFLHENRWVILVALLLLVPAWVKGINLLLLLALLIIAMWGVNWVVAGRQVRRLKSSRIWHGPIYAGRIAHWDIELRNDSQRPATGIRLNDIWPDHNLEWFIDRIEGRQTIRLHAAIVLPHRGPYRLGPVIGSSLHPFGVAHRRKRTGLSEDCLVLPRLGRLNTSRFERWLSQRSQSDGQAQRTARPSMLHQDDLHGLRPFRAGDNPRWIHWLTSARKNQKMVREFEQDTGHELIILVEPYSPNPDQKDPRQETSISLAAPNCWDCHRLGGARHQLGIFGPKPIIATRRGGGDSAMEMLRCLALAVGSTSIDPTPLMKRLPAPASRSMPVVLVTTYLNSPLVGRLTKMWNRPVHALNPESARDFFDETAPAE